MDHRSRLETIKKMKRDEQISVRRKVNEGIARRTEKARNNKSFQLEENEKRKEIRLLHKMD